MALNPSYDTTSTRKLPLAFGYVYGAGDDVLTTIAQDGSQYDLLVLGEGEWDGPEIPNTYSIPSANPPVPSHLYQIYNRDRSINSAGMEFANVIHFHSGTFSTIGVSSSGTGPEQFYDEWFSQFPSVIPTQTLSGIAYAIWKLPAPPAFHRGTAILGVSCFNAIWRSTRCRIFDGSGNVIDYRFTCNPVWHRIEAILRYKIKPQQPPVAGLTSEEKACFGWDSIATLAARNDFVLPNGNPRFVGNYLFASDASLTNILETSMRCDRSYMRTDGGVISMIGDDSRTSVFQASLNHLVPGSLSLNKQDVSQSTNRFIPRYLDLDIPAVSVVTTARRYPQFNLGGTAYEAYLQVTTTTPSPFDSFGAMTYGGAADASFDGDYTTQISSGYPYPPAIPNVTFAYLPGAGSLASTTGGFLGTQDSRFKQRAPMGVQHLSAQKIAQAQAPGLTPQPRINPGYYDCGNSTFDQTNRLMKFERDRSLGTDTGAGWKAPVAGTLTLFFDAVDSSGRRLLDVRTHDVITLDSWLTPRFAGDYEVMEMPAITTPGGDQPGTVELTLKQYYANAYTDVSDSPGNYYQNVPGTGLTLGAFSGGATELTPVLTRYGGLLGYVLQATLSVCDAGDGTVTVTIPDLTIWNVGQPASSWYPEYKVASIPKDTNVILFISDPSGVGFGGGGSGFFYGYVRGTGRLSPSLFPASTQIIATSFPSTTSYSACLAGGGSGGGGDEDGGSGGGGGDAPPIYYPSTYQDLQNDAEQPALDADYAYDGDLSTAAVLFAAFDGTENGCDIIYSSFGSGTAGSSGALKITVGSSNDMGSGGQLTINVSYNGGASWTTVDTIGPPGGDPTATLSYALPSGQDMSLLQVEFISIGVGPGSSIFAALLYDVHAEG